MSKRHKPTAKRLRKARQEGKVFKSVLATQFATLTTCFITIILGASSALVRFKMLLEYCLVHSSGAPLALAAAALELAFTAVAVILLPAALVGVLVETLQVGFSVEVANLKLKPSRLDLGAGLLKVFSGLRQSWQPALRLALFSAVFYWFAQNFAHQLVLLVVSSVAQRIGLISKVLVVVLLCALGVTLISSAVELLIRRRERFNELAMTDQELRQELREEEGEPLIRAMRRQMHESILMQDLIPRIKRSRVVIVERK